MAAPKDLSSDLRDIVERTSGDHRPTPTTWTRALARPKRALYLSSAIGLGHARRDLAIARAGSALDMSRARRGRMRRSDEAATEPH